MTNTPDMMAMIFRTGSVYIMAKQQRNQPGESFGQRLARIRKQKGYTQTELAKAIGVTQRVISYYECETQHPPTALLPHIAEALQVSTDTLLGLDALPADAPMTDLPFLNKLRDLQSLPPSDRKAIVQVIDAMLARQQKGKS
jgi:transcriptional regulator with XRE-family HTH domain